MIQVPARQLPPEANAKLNEYQAAIDAEPDYVRRVALAYDRFKQHNKATNAAFRHVRRLLTEMCSGARRCMYCEDSVADEIEHHKPKNFYPSDVFRWENFLYACGPCNGPKQHQFAIFDLAAGFVELQNDPVMQPPAGSPVLLHPRSENPFDYLILDIVGDTFLFVPSPGPDDRNMRRAQYTIELLKLNDRDYLPRARRGAFVAYRALLRDCVNQRDHADELARIRLTLNGMHHVTVWREMKRQRDSIAELRDLFLHAPQALDW